ncbi:MAG: PAS domain S-box protein [Methanoregula sp.]
MDSMIIQDSVTLFEILCVIIVFASIFMRSRFFQEVYEKQPSLTTQAILIIFFGILSIFGTLSGLAIYGAVINIRDLGPMAAGLVCGPYIGIGSGIIGGLFRFYQGGPYMWTGLSAPILSGILGGIMYLANRRRFVPVWVAVLLIGLSETLISCYTLVLVTKPSEFFTVLTMVALPMIAFNVIGMFIFASIVHNVIDEREARKKMQALELEVESKRNLRAVINTIAYPVYVLDLDHRFILVNDSLCHFIGHTQEEILGRTPRDFFGNVDSAFHRDMVDTSLRETTHEEEVTITLPARKVDTLITTSTLHADASGRVFMVGVIQDITERRKMQVALAENEAWYRNLFEHTGAATIIINDDGTIDQANSEFARLTGYSREEIEGKMSWTQFAHPDELERIKKYHHERRIDPASVPDFYTLKMHDRSGALKILHAVVAMIPGTKKSIASYVDISEQKKSEDAVTQVNRKLNLLSSITRHDILNQILVLKGYLSLLKTKTTDPDLLNYINRSEKATQNIDHQIIFTRDYQDMGVKAPVWQNVRNTIIGAKGALHLRNVTFEVDHPEFEIFADPLFEKVFYNLIDNSLQYGGEGLQTIRISSQEESISCVITYQDDGIGIPEGDHDRLFERGFGKHSGFGLFLSREILSITGISIEENGTPGSGARFIIRVPRGMYRFANGSIPQAQ